jgi:hypothetical protein
LEKREIAEKINVSGIAKGSLFCYLCTPKSKKGPGFGRKPAENSGCKTTVNFQEYRK